MYMNIIELFDKAKQSLKWPRLTYDNPETGIKLKFTLAGPNSKYPGSINITDGQGYGNGVFYGRIVKVPHSPIPRIQYRDVGPEIMRTIEKIYADPVTECKLLGQRFSFCCF